MVTVMVKHLIILANINNIYKLEEASKALLEELLRITDVIVLRRKPITGTTALYIMGRRNKKSRKRYKESGKDIENTVLSHHKEGAKES